MVPSRGAATGGFAPVAYFTLRDARHTLATAAEGTGLEGSIYAGLESLTENILGRGSKRVA
ncbi:hypothetical protein RISK_002433 [Rhodopirellula islandica]|uniref:Uncharacterized protein n=1 Tax=Rhodopirellula islandica TaxID=595434 RepID=A0A0J1BH03_RHOIS|nr:hypothetical protein [Rhodopirellula islandica]KLU05801.1 hypothetical protein RISK_002433 [Rhodopirellula islandica]